MVVCECGKVKKASYGFIKDRKKTCCAKCKKDGMIDLVNINRLCICGIRPCFGFKDDGKKTCCSKCKKDGMINLTIIDRLCSCGINPSFGFENDGKRTCCSKCKKDGMINLANIKKLCKCGKQSSFGFESDKKKTCCSKCKKDGMVNLTDINRLCPCGKQSSFGFESNRERICCVKCKKDGMIDLVNINKLCPCGTIPAFGFRNDGERTCCSKCKKDGMVDLANINRLCPCGTVSSFGFPSFRATKCFQHKESDMIKHPTKKCLKKDCDKHARFGLSFPSHCKNHKEPNHIDRILKECPACKRIDVLITLNNKTACINYCFKKEQSLKCYRSHTKHKQERILALLKQQFGEPTFYDKRIGSSLLRPDIVYRFPHITIIIEVDEDGHSSYSEEDRRMINIHNDLNANNTFFIRYNPDNFRINDTLTDVSLEEREMKLISIFETIRDFSRNVELSVIYLFYDNYNYESKNYISINPDTRQRFQKQFYEMTEIKDVISVEE